MTDQSLLQTVLNGRYSLDEKIGEGGMAIVYRGQDLRLNRRVAIKVLHRMYATDPEFLARFRHEGQAAAVLSHPHIVDIYDVGQDGDTHYIVMEFINGVNLKSVIAREAPLAVGRAIDIAMQVCDGLDAAHRVGLIHRDIKPQNIIIRSDGQAYITDFGIAKSFLSSDLTRTGMTFGTADYISPEQAQGRPVTPRTDIYAMGVTLYEMLTARLPFTGESPVVVATQHVNNEPQPPRRLNPAIPPQLESLVLSAMAKDEAYRPATGNEFGRMLAACRDSAAGDTIQAAAPTIPRESIGRVPQMNRPANPPPRPTSMRPPKEESSSGWVGMLLITALLVGLILAGMTYGPGVIESLAQGFRGIEPPARLTPITVNTATPKPTPTITVTPLPRVLAPDLVGLTEDQARELITQRGLVPVAGPAKPSDSFAVGVVMEQALSPGSEIVEGGPLTYTLSQGSPLVSVPDMVQVRQAVAEQMASEAGLQVEVVEEASRDVSEGFVIRQAPNSGARLQRGDTVRVFVSVGDKVRFNAIGKSRAEAEAELASSGLVLDYVDEQGPDRLPNFESYSPNQVISALVNGASAGNGDYIDRGSRVVLGVRAP